MNRILFVCHGNICRSPMAEYILRDLAEKRGIAGCLEIGSAATSSEELGNPVYPPVRSLLARQGIDCSGKRARQIRREDYSDYDLLLGMDSANLRNMQRFFGGDPKGKLHLLLDYTDSPGDVADPWYTRDFEAARRDIHRGCEGLLRQLKLQ